MAIAYANQIDPRVQMNDATADVWAGALKAHPAERVRWAIKHHYATGNANGEGVHAVTPARIRRLIQNKTEEAETRGRALEPPRNRTPNPLTLRRRDPAEWDRLVAEGAEQFKRQTKS